MEPEVRVLVWTIVVLKGPPNVRFQVNWWEGTAANFSKHMELTDFPARQEPPHLDPKGPFGRFLVLDLGPAPSYPVKGLTQGTSLWRVLLLNEREPSQFGDNMVQQRSRGHSS